MKKTILITILLSLMTGCSVSLQVVLYQRGGVITSPHGESTTDSTAETAGGGSPNLQLPLDENTHPLNHPANIDM